MKKMRHFLTNFSSNTIRRKKMYNLMIIEQNTFKLTEIINSIGARFQNIRICHISDDIKNTFEILENIQ